MDNRHDQAMSFLRKLRKKLVFGAIPRRAVSYGQYLEVFREYLYLKSLLERRRINCVLDVGANEGQFASDLRYAGYAGQIISFEPLKAPFARMKAAFANDPNWSGHQLALGCVEEERALNVGEDSKMTSFLQSEAVGIEGREIIKVRRLDDIFDTLPLDGRESRLLLKTDTQGFDLEVFRGASGCLSSIDALMAEVSVEPIYHGMTRYPEALAAYEAEGFKLYNLSVVSRNVDSGIVEMNCLMARSGN